MLKPKAIALINPDIKQNPTPHIITIVGMRASPIMNKVLMVPDVAILKACFRNQ
jgi:hypothetical protein